MTIAVISDTHDRLDTLERAVQVFKQHGVELVIHCGDWIAPFTVAKTAMLVKEHLGCPIKGVFGNNDADIFQILTRNRTKGWDVDFGNALLTFEAAGRRIAVYHGTEPAITESLIASKRYDAVFSGHTHVPLSETKNGVLHLNPGSTSYIRNGAIIDEATVAVYDTKSNSARILKI